MRYSLISKRKNVSQLNLSLNGISSINHRFQWLSRSLRQINYILLTRAPLVSKEASFFLLPFDLHVLSTPPAFTLSQDQTLHNCCPKTWLCKDHIAMIIYWSFAQELKFIGFVVYSPNIHCLKVYMLRLYSIYYYRELNIINYI